MFELNLGWHTLRVTESKIEYGGREVDPREATAVRWVRTNTYVNGALVNKVRLIKVRDRHDSISLNCAAVSSASVETLFQKAWSAIWNTAGMVIAERAVFKLHREGEVELAGIKLDRTGVWVDGRWRFLWWSGQPRLIPWGELKVSHSDIDLMMQSIVDRSKTSTRNFNSVDNTPVLDFVVRHVLENLGALTQGDSPHKP